MSSSLLCAATENNLFFSLTFLFRNLKVSLSRFALAFASLFFPLLYLSLSFTRSLALLTLRSYTIAMPTNQSVCSIDIWKKKKIKKKRISVLFIDLFYKISFRAAFFSLNVVVALLLLLCFYIFFFLSPHWKTHHWSNERE